MKIYEIKWNTWRQNINYEQDNKREKWNFLKKNVKKDKLKIEGNGQKLKTYLWIIYDDNEIIELP